MNFNAIFCYKRKFTHNSIYRTGITRVISGNVLQNQRDGEGIIQVKYTTQPLASEATLVVLDTDYDSYAVMWSCSGFGPVHSGINFLYFMNIHIFTFI